MAISPYYLFCAVTCESYINFNDYIRNEGMVGRIVSTPKEGQIDPERLLHNIDVVYQITALLIIKRSIKMKI